MLTGAVGNEGQAAIVMQLKTVRPSKTQSFLAPLCPALSTCYTVKMPRGRTSCVCVYFVGFVVWVFQLYGEYLRGLNLEEIEELATALLAKQP
jgi:hypothetical protein